MLIRPSKGRQVRDPYTREVVPGSGRRVPDTSYWRRRLRDGDVEIAPVAQDDLADAIPDAAPEDQTKQAKKTNPKNGGKK